MEVPLSLPYSPACGAGKGGTKILSDAAALHIGTYEHCKR